jgi:hypothetical protein
MLQQNMRMCYSVFIFTVTLLLFSSVLLYMTVIVSILFFCFLLGNCVHNLRYC